MKSTSNSRSFDRYLPRLGQAAAVLSAGFLVFAACSDDGDGDGGAAGSSGSNMPAAGAGGSMSAAGAGGMGGTMNATAGSNLGGSGGGGMAAGPTATVEVVNDDQAVLLVPTTGDVRNGNIWVAIGQLGALFDAEVDPVTPFEVVSISLDDGSVGADTIELPGDDFYPEGVAVGPDGSLFVGSIGQGTIYRAGPGSTEAELFMDAGVAQRGVIGMTVGQGGDAGVLWFCDSSPVAGSPAGAVVGVSLSGVTPENTATQLFRYNLPERDIDGTARPPFCNDIVVTGDDDLWVTDSAGRIFRIEGALTGSATPEVWMEGGLLESPVDALTGFGANGLLVLGDDLIIANSDAGSLVRVPTDSTDPDADAEVITLMEEGAQITLCGPDGLAAVPGADDELLVVENSFCNGPARVARVSLD